LTSDVSKQKIIAKINKLMQDEIDFSDQKLLAYNEYLKLIESNDDLKALMDKELFHFPEKFLKSNCAMVISWPCFYYFVT
jgi:hypothetical protein